MEINSYEDPKTRRIAELELALAKLINCIESSALDNGPLAARASMMAQACRVIQNTTQFTSAREALSRS